MVNGIFITTARLSESSGGGKVSIHELNAMRKFCDKVDVITSDDIRKEVHNNPFLYDFSVCMKINDKYDLAHFNGHPFSKTLATLKYYNPDIKVVTSVPAHNLEVSIEEHRLCGVDYAKAYPHMVNPDYFREYTNQDRKADVVIYPSKQSMDYYVNKLSLTNRQVVIPHGTLLPPEPSSPSIPSRVTFGYIGALGPDKGVRILLESFAKSPDATLNVYGEGTKEYFTKLGIKNIVGKGGFGKYEDIINEFDVGVFPSVTEGFNLSVLELAAYGKPSILSSGVGCQELFKQDECMAKITPDIPSLIGAIKYAKANPSKVVERGLKARKVAERYPWSKIEDIYVDVYRSLF
jgi:glycosyltransferase involved in cell wall biosynthesis